MKHQIATTIEQSKRLLACGVDSKSADMVWLNRGKLEPYLTFNMGSNRAIPEVGDIPAWSLSTLLALLPTKIDKGYYLTMQRCNALGSPFAYGLAYMLCDYDDVEDLDNWHTHSVGKKCVTNSDNPIEAVIRAIEWLVQNGYSLNTPKQ